MSTITLKPITRENWRVCVGLTVEGMQKNFVATNAKSLAQAAYETQWRPMGIYADDEMVGFVMFGLEAYQGKDVWDIIRVMVDTKHQGNGYGRAGIAQVLEIMRSEKPDITDVYISFVLQNDGARHVYSKLGFQDVGMTPDGSEVLMKLTL